MATLQAVIEARGAKAGADQFNRSVDSMDRRAKKAGKSLGNIDKSFNKLRGSALRLGSLFGAGLGLASLVGVVRSAVGTMIEFNRVMSNVSALTGATGKDLDFIREKALEFGRTTTVAAVDVAEAFKLMASAKPDLLANVEALAATTREAITLRDAAGIDLASAIVTLGGALNQFSAGAQEANKFINVLAAGAKFGASEISDTALALKDSGTVAAAAGISFEELNASIQLLASISIKGARAGVGLRNVILRLQTGADETNPAIVGLQQALLNLGKQSLTAAQLTKLFGLESVVVAQRLIQEANALGTLTERLTDTSTAMEQAETNLNNLSGDIDKLGTAFGGLGIKITESSDSIMREGVQNWTVFVNFVTSKMDAMGDAISNGVGAIALVLGNAANASRGFFDESFKASLELVASIESVGDALSDAFSTIPLTELDNLAIAQRRVVESNEALASKLFDLLSTFGLAGDQIEEFSGTLNVLRERFEGGIITSAAYSGGLQDLEKDLKAASEKALDLAKAQATLEEAFNKTTLALLPVKKAQADLNEFVDKFLDLAVRAGGQVLEDFRAGVNRLALKLVDAEAAQAKFTEGQIKNTSSTRVLKGVTEDLTDAFRESTDGIKIIKGVTVQHTGAVANLTSATESLSSANERNAETVREIARAQDALSDSLIREAQSESLARGILAGTGLGGSESLKFGLGAQVITPGGAVSITSNPTVDARGAFAGLQHGGLFKVRGVGGPDSQDIRIRATPGETLQAIPPGRGGGKGDTVITINQRFNVAPGADVDGFRRTLRQSNRVLVRALKDTG